MLRKITTKFILSFTLVITIVLISSKPVVAATNFEGSVYGFNVDEDYYNVSWDDVRTTNAYYNSKVIGITKIYIGKAVSKKKVQNQILVTYMIAVKTSPQNPNYSKKVLWWTNKWTEYGYYKTCKVNATVASGTTLFDSTPKDTPSDTSYSVGISAGVDSSGLNAGLNGSVGFTSKAINITNKSKESTGNVDIGINLNNSIWRWDWGRYKYASQDNFQLFTFSVLTRKTDTFSQSITVNTSYGTADTAPKYWMTLTGNSGNANYGAVTHVTI